MSSRWQYHDNGHLVLVEKYESWVNENDTTPRIDQDVLWRAGTGGSSPGYTKLHDSGLLEVRDVNGTQLYNNGIVGNDHSGATLEVLNDGTFVIYNGTGHIIQSYP